MIGFFLLALVAGSQAPPLGRADPPEVRAARAIDSEADPAGAVTAWQRAMPVARRSFRANQREMGEALLAYGQALIASGRDGEALPLLEEAQPIIVANFAATDKVRAQATISLALARATAGASDGALSMLEALAAAQRGTGGGDSVALADTIYNIGSIEQQVGRLDIAAGHVAEALALYRRLLPPDDEVTIGTATSLSSIYTQAGRLADAEEMGREAVGMASRGLPSDHPLSMIVLANYAAALDTQGRWQESEPLYRRLLPLRLAKLGPNSLSVAITQTNFARALRLSGRPEEALPLFEASVQLATRLLADGDPRLNQMRENLADGYRDLGRHDDALPLLRKAVIALQATSPQHFRLASLQQVLASELLWHGDADAAEQAIGAAQTIRLATLAPDHPALLGGEIAAGYIAARRGNAVAGLARAMPAYRRLTAIAAANETEISRDLVFRGGFEAMGRLAWLTRDDELAFDVGQRLVAGDAGRAIAAAVARGSGPGAQAVRARQDLVARRAAQSRLALDRYSRDAAGYAAAMAAIAQIDGQLRTTAAPVAATIATLAGARAHLSRDSALLLLVPLSDTLLAMAVDRHGVVLDQGDVSRRRITDLVDRMRGAVDGGSSRGALADGVTAPPPVFDVAAAHELYGLLLPGRMRAAAERHAQWRIASAGPLLKLPFVALVRDPPKPGQAPQWLVRTTAVELVAGQGDGLVPVAGSGDRFVGIGAPELAAAAMPDMRRFRDAGGALRSVNDLPPLPGAARELEALDHVLGADRSLLLIGASATEGAVRAADLKGVRVLAFATHGLAAGDIGGGSEAALVLTPVSQAADDDGLLTTSEIATLSIDADLVMLSACNSAAGDASGTPHLSGLARAFFYAGARSLLVSHWPVRDDVAATMTVAVAKAIARGREPAAALRRAMLETIRTSTVNGMADPGIWAPFTLVSR